MNVINCKDIDCSFLKKKFKLFEKQGIGGTILIYNEKLLIKKINKINEINNIIKIINLFQNYQYKIFIASHYKTYFYENNYYIFMKRYNNSIRFIEYDNISEFKNLIQQGLIFTLFLNFNLNLYHNDLHLKNCLFKKINHLISIKFKDLKIIITNKLLKIIDFNSLSDKIDQHGNIGRKILKNKKIKNDFIYFLLSCLTYFRVSKNKVIIQKTKNFDFKNIFQIINNLNIQNNLNDFVKLYKYIDLNFNKIFSV